MTRAILLVDHGSRREEANVVVEEVARQVSCRLAERAPRTFTFVQAAHMELAEPDVAGGIDACVAAGAEEIVVHPFFLGPGNHTTHDIPRLVEDATKRHPGVRVRISAPLGPHAKLAEVVLERVEAAQ